MDKMLCNKYQNCRSTLLVYMMRLVNPDIKTKKAIIQPIIAVVVKGRTKSQIPISQAITPDHNERRFIKDLLGRYPYSTIFLAKGKGSC